MTMATMAIGRSIESRIIFIGLLRSFDSWRKGAAWLIAV
jgi:hypothetical protein